MTTFINLKKGLQIFLKVNNKHLLEDLLLRYLQVEVLVIKVILLFIIPLDLKITILGRRKVTVHRGIIVK